MSRLTELHIPPEFGPESGKPSHHRSRRTRADAEPCKEEGDDAGTGTGTRAVAGWR